MPSEEQPDINAKKRKREALNEADPKLQEFLNVMQASKISANRLHGHEDDSVLEPPTKKIATSDEAELDDAYQSMPASTRKRIPTPPPRIVPKSPPIKPRAVPIVDSSTDEPTFPNQPTEELVSNPVDNSQNITTGMGDDDDWLRNRTNRLLDLGDEDDIIPVRSQPTTAMTSEEQEFGTVAPNSVDMTEENAVADIGEVVQETDSQDAATLDAIRKTARIFCRNLPYDATTEDLRAHFEKFGEVEEVRDYSFFRYFPLDPFYDEAQIGTAELFLMRTLGQYFSRCSGF